MTRAPSQHRALRSELQQHLTHASRFDAQATQTYEGMAFFAGTGPAGVECGRCGLFMLLQQRRAGGRCAQFVRLTGKQGKAFPSYAMSCKYYAARAV